MRLYEYPEVAHSDYPKYPGLCDVHTFIERLRLAAVALVPDIAREQFEASVEDLQGLSKDFLRFTRSCAKRSLKIRMQNADELTPAAPH